MNFIDRIGFDIGSQAPRIQLQRLLPNITEAVTIDGILPDGKRVEISGGQITRLNLPGSPPVHGLVVLGTFTTLKSLVINGFGGAGIILTHLDEGGQPLLDPPIPEKPGETWSDPCPVPQPLFEMDPANCRPPPPGGDPDLPAIEGAGGGSNTVVDSLIGTDPTGTVAIPNGDGSPGAAGIVVLTAGNTIGGIGPRMRNAISGNRGSGVRLTSVNNRLIGNLIGVGAGNQLNGVLVDGGDKVQATCDIRSNTITSNGASGVDAGFNFCWILSNSVSSNGSLGIDRAMAGLTANDPTGGRSRPPNHPILEAVGSTSTGSTLVFGTIAQRSFSPVMISLFDSPSCDPSGSGEGAFLVGSAVVSSPLPQGALFRVVVPALQRAGNHFYTATATTDEGGTSEFSSCMKH